MMTSSCTDVEVYVSVIPSVSEESGRPGAPIRPLHSLTLGMTRVSKTSSSTTNTVYGYGFVGADVLVRPRGEAALTRGRADEGRPPPTITAPRVAVRRASHSPLAAMRTTPRARVRAPRATLATHDRSTRV